MRQAEMQELFGVPNFVALHSPQARYLTCGVLHSQAAWAAG